MRGRTRFLASSLPPARAPSWSHLRLLGNPPQPLPIPWLSPRPGGSCVIPNGLSDLRPFFAPPPCAHFASRNPPPHRRMCATLLRQSHAAVPTMLLFCPSCVRWGRAGMLPPTAHPQPQLLPVVRPSSPWKGITWTIKCSTGFQQVFWVCSSRSVATPVCRPQPRRRRRLQWSPWWFLKPAG